jgi:hypothetical protein
MVESPPGPPDQPVMSEPATARAIRYAVYVTGGLVVLAFGVLTISSSLGTILNCLVQDDFCSGGFSTGIYYNTLPSLGGGVFFVVVAVVLFWMAHRAR